jgi:hypothetical protein
MASSQRSNANKSTVTVEELDVLLEELLDIPITKPSSPVAFSDPPRPECEILDIDITAKTTKTEMEKIFKSFGWTDCIPKGKLHGTKRKRADTKVRLRDILLAKKRKIASHYTSKLRNECEERGFLTSGNYEQLKARLEGTITLLDSSDKLRELLEERALAVPKDPCAGLLSLLKYEWEQGVKRCKWNEDWIFGRKQEFQIQDEPKTLTDVSTQTNSDETQPAIHSDDTSASAYSPCPSKRNDHTYDGRVTGIYELRDFEYSGTRIFGIRNVIGDGNCLPRALAACLWGRHEERMWRHVKNDVAEMWKEAMTQDTPMAVLRGTDYSQLVLHVHTQRIADTAADIGMTMPELVEQIDPDGNRWCTDAYLQLVSDCYDVAIYTFSESEINGQSVFQFSRFAGRQSEEGQIYQRQIFLANNGNHWKALLPLEPFCTVAWRYRLRRKALDFENDMDRHQRFAPIWSVIPDINMVQWRLELPMRHPDSIWDAGTKYPRSGEMLNNSRPDPFRGVGIHEQLQLNPDGRSITPE